MARTDTARIARVAPKFLHVATRTPLRACILTIHPRHNTPDGDHLLDLKTFDPELAAAMASEAQRQQDHLELIASENYTSVLVMQAQGSVLTN